MSDNQVALVTGATGTIGRAVATELGARGAALVLTGRRKDVLDEVAGELRGRGVRVETAVGDVADPAHAEQAVALASEAFGPVTTLVNNAGGGGGAGTSVADSDRPRGGNRCSPTRSGPTCSLAPSCRRWCASGVAGSSRSPAGPAPRPFRRRRPTWSPRRR